MPCPPLKILIFGLLLSLLPLRSEPFSQAENAFVSEVNSMAGIDLVGGPFSIGERYVFGGESGYFVIVPTERIAGLDQRLSVQTRRIDPTRRILPSLPIVSTETHDSPVGLEPGLTRVLAQHGIFEKRDEVTLLGVGSVRLRPVLAVPLINSRILASNSFVALIGAQSWQGVPLFRVSFDRRRGDLETELLREGFIPKRGAEIPVRPFPVYSPQTFFAEPGLPPNDWRTVLRNFSRLNLPASRILDAFVTDQTVTIRADLQGPVLPQTWVRLKKNSGEWVIEEAVELRAEFPRPGQWWSFLPLLPEARFVDRFPEQDSGVKREERMTLGPIAERLRGVGHVSQFALVSHGADRIIRVRTSQSGWRGYNLDFVSSGGNWRLHRFAEWAE